MIQTYSNKKIIFSLSIIFVIYVGFSSAAINEIQLVPGEMWILYTADRITEGLILYEDIVIVYGPVFYLIISGLLELGISYPGLKIFMLLISITNSLLVFFAGKQLFEDSRIAILSCGIFTFIPIHYGIAPAVHVDSFAVLLVLLTFNLILLRKKSALMIAGIISSIVVFTKISPVPIVLAPIIYFIIKKNRQVIHYLIPFLILVTTIGVYLTTVKKDDLTNFMFDWVTRYPDEPYTMLRDYLWIEGFVVLISILGAILYMKKFEKNSLILLMGLVSIITFSSIMIRGTNIYAAQYMEPFIAIFSAFAIFSVADKIKERKNKRIQKLIPLIIILLVFSQFIIFDFPNRERIADWRGDRWQAEYNELIITHSNLIKEHTSENDIVVAIPTAAFKTGRILALDDHPYSDILQKKKLMGYESAEIKIQEMKDMIESKKIKFLVGANTTRNDGEKHPLIELDFFYPFNLDIIEESIQENYDEFFENGYYYYKPKIDR